jgi:hypothetical protein
LSICFIRLAEEWQGVYWHEKTRSLLNVYVDDVKFAAKTEAHDSLWKSIREVIDMDPENPDCQFLGCSPERHTTTAAQVHTILDNHPACHPRPKLGAGAKLHVKAWGDEGEGESYKLYDPHRSVELVVYNLERFAKDCVNVFWELVGYEEKKAGSAPTPFLDEPKDTLTVIQERAATSGQITPPGTPSGAPGDPQGVPAKAGSTGQLSPDRNQVLDENHVHRTVREAGLATSSRGTHHDDYTLGRDV